MATISFLTKRIEGKQAALKKLNAKLDRIRKAEASNWEDNNPYMYSESDLRSCLIDIKDAERAIEKYQSELAVEQAKANNRTIPELLEFLERWQQESLNFYITKFEHYLLDKEACADKLNSYPINFVDMDERNRNIEIRDQIRTAFQNRWRFIFPYVCIKNGQKCLDENKLKYDLKNEADRKYDYIIARTTKIVGTVTDASDLHIGIDGELNGLIKGTDGNARVTTIGAGGYNIQRFHFRTLIHSEN